MPSPYILDTDPTKAGDADTFSTFAAVHAQIKADHGSDLKSPAAGVLTLYLRNSSGVPLAEYIDLKYLGGDATNYVDTVAQIVNGNPFVWTDGAALTGTSLIQFNADGYKFRSEEEDALIFRSNLANANNRSLVSIYKDITIDGAVFDGNGSINVGGVYSSFVSTVKNSKILRCNREFYGAIRGGNTVLTNCTIADCWGIRDAGILTNSQVINTSLTAGDGLAVGSNYNAYDSAKVLANYENQAAMDADVNSIFSVDVATQLIADPIGGYDLAAGSSLIGAASDGGNIGAYATALTGTPPQISITLTGSTLSALVSDDTTANPSLQLFIDGASVGAAQTGLSWDLTSYGLTPETVFYRITVQATDDDLNSSTSNVRYYSDRLKILWIGNSLTQTSISPVNSTHSVIEHVEEMYGANGSYIFIEPAILGGSNYTDHNANQPTHDKINTGNYDIILAQHENHSSDGYADYQAYLVGEMQPLMDAAEAVGSNWVGWYRQPYDSDTITEYNKQETDYAQSLVWYPTMQGIDVMKGWWDAMQADPTIDLYADNIHQNAGGSYLSALGIYKFFSGVSVANMPYVDPILTNVLGDSGLGYTGTQVQLLKDSADAAVTNQFVRSSVNSCVVTVTAPVSAIEVTEGDSVTFTATAIDSSTGDLSANIVWKSGETVLHTGATFSTTSLPTGDLLITAEAVGSDTNTSTGARSVKVVALVNVAPVSTGTTRSVDYNAVFTQTNLVSLVTDDNNEVDWSTLVITQQPANGVATIDNQTPSTVNVDYSSSNYSAADSFKYTVKDLGGLTSNESTVSITVQPQSAPSGVIANSQITRGQPFDIVMSDHTAGVGAEVWVIDGVNEYECTMTVYTDSLITATCASIGSPIASASIEIRPITTLAN